MDGKVLIILADGFEEIEAFTPIDILRRADVDVVVAGLGEDMVTGAHGITVKTDIDFEDYKGVPEALILPGGMPGAENLAGSIKLKDLIRKMNSKNKLIAAICASPALVLGPTGILQGRKATCYPGLEVSFTPEIAFSKKEVVQDGNIITSRGPATAFKFGLKIAEELVGKDKSDMIAKQMVFKA